MFAYPEYPRITEIKKGGVLSVSLSSIDPATLSCVATTGHGSSKYFGSWDSLPGCPGQQQRVTQQQQQGVAARSRLCSRCVSTVL
jgi:hypothetical protein